MDTQDIRDANDVPDTKEEEKPRKPRKIAFKRLAALLLVLAAVVLVITEATGATQAFASFFNPAMHFVEGAYITHEIGSAAQISPSDDGFFLATRDSVRFHNVEGSEVFRHGHVMVNPVLFGRGNYAAILEQNGRVVNVYNTEGLLYSIVTDAPISGFALGIQGFAAIITHSGGGVYDYEVRNNSGTRINYGRHACENIVPLLADISHDGRVLAMSFLDINDAEMNSFVSFFSIDGGHVATDGIFAENRQNPGQIIGAMRFMADGTLVAISDTRIFAMDATAATRWERPLNNRITHVDFSYNWFAIAHGESLLNRTGHPPHTVIAYSSANTQLFSHSAPNAVGSLQANGNNLVIGSGDQFTALTNTGQELWQLALPNNVQSVNIMGNSNNVAVFSPTRTEILRRVRYN
ncbi:MAG: DUF5711 family protein [Defluviitaleaceae bacterium]|nr:DUF5711 family protein [Defluviitaleaceae bacterium]